MATFVPPTYKAAITGEEEHNLPKKHRSMWRHYGGVFPTGYTVLITGGVATPSPGVISPTVDQINAADSGSGDSELAYFRGGLNYTVTAAEATILTTAGYVLT